jgi:HSP20 family protein
MALDIQRRPWSGDLTRDIVPLRTMMDRLFETAFTPTWAGWSGTRQAGWFDMDVEEDDNAYYVSCRLPGIDPNDVTISAQGNTLSISGETKRTTPEGRRAVFQESSYGRFERQITLDTSVDAAKAEATYRNGVLEVTLPKAEAHKPRTIQIKQAA